MNDDFNSHLGASALPDLAERIARWAQKQADDRFPVYADPIREMIEGEMGPLRAELARLRAVVQAAKVYRESLRAGMKKLTDPAWRERFQPAADQTAAAWRDLSAALDAADEIGVQPPRSAFGDWTTLGELRDGAIFETADGIRAVKSEYRYGNEPGSQCQCVLLESGEYAHFPEKNGTRVREMILR